jgi:hypothetical protein
MAMCAFRTTIKISTYLTNLCTNERETIGLMKVKSWNTLFRVPLVCIYSILKSVLRHNVVTEDTCVIRTLHLLEQGCEDPSLFF